MDLMKSLRLLGDVGRVRIMRLLAQDELSVADLQEILGMGQSRISMQLSQLRTAGFVDVRRSGQKSLYHLSSGAAEQPIVTAVLARANSEIPEARRDDAGVQLILERRRDHLKSYFDDLAGKFGRHYVPGRSWKGLAEMLLKLLPPMVIADLGAGEGTLSLLLAQRAKQVIALDSSPKMVEYGAALVREHGISNLEYRCGDMEEPPIDDGSVDLALFHQALHHALHPELALRQAHRILKPDGNVIVVDLLKHDVEEARDLYADVWLGFSQVELIDMLTSSGFVDVDVSVVDTATEPPHFETVLAVARRGS